MDEIDRHEGERRKLYENEAFAITVFQAVSAASAFGIISQVRVLKKIAGILPVLITLTILILALVAAVAAALFRHQYKMWDVKAVASASRMRNDEAAERAQWSENNLWRMRHSMIASASLIVSALLLLIGAIWVTYLTS